MIDAAQFRARMIRGAVERDAALSASSIPGRPYRENSMTAQAMRRLAEKHKSVLSHLGARADALTARLERAENLGDAAMDKHDRGMDDVEASVREVEDLVNQLSNDGPPLDRTSPPATDINGVTVNKN